MNFTSSTFDSSLQTNRHAHLNCAHIIKGTALIVGATSAIARALATELACTHHAIHLGARNLNELARISSDLSIRHSVPVTVGEFKAEDYQAHAQFLDSAVEEHGKFDVIIVCIGEMIEQKQAEDNVQASRQIIESNYTGVVSFLTHAANYLEREKSGSIVVVSSVAGDRGRPSNYVYGSAKAGLSVFLQGLRARLSKSGVHVMTVKPGFVDTKMTFGKKGLFLVASAEQVAKSIMKDLSAKKDVVYVPWFWYWIMAIISMIPERIFKRLNL